MVRASEAPGGVGLAALRAGVRDRDAECPATQDGGGVQSVRPGDVHGAAMG
ncbi:MAG: hypothetical protein IT384_22690 [Deltaproteobacteria bacterium]|nr:hypothetical protein [Deltaproteobacteria bacterium]